MLYWVYKIEKESPPSRRAFLLSRDFHHRKHCHSGPALVAGPL